MGLLYCYLTLQWNSKKGNVEMLGAWVTQGLPLQLMQSELRWLVGRGEEKGGKVRRKLN
jgi:hypothetical protein